MRLLVSVVSAVEARRALAGGADIVDVKDPGEGPLGAPAPRVLSEVVRAVDGAVPVSVALGDLPDLPHTAALAARGAAVSGAAFVKVGLRGVRSLDRAVAVMSAVLDAVADQVAVIAVGYADAGALDPPALDAALLPGCRRENGDRRRARRHVRQGRARPVRVAVGGGSCRVGGAHAGGGGDVRRRGTAAAR